MAELEMNCEATKKHVHEFLQKELSDQELDAITAHIANCDHCEWEYDFEAALTDVVKVSCSETPADEIADKILAKLRSIDLSDIKH